MRRRDIEMLAKLIENNIAYSYWMPASVTAREMGHSIGDDDFTTIEIVITAPTGHGKGFAYRVEVTPEMVVDMPAGVLADKIAKEFTHKLLKKKP